MQAKFNKEKIHINKVVAEKKEVFFVEDDIIVPDSKPDILNSISASGNICIYNKEIIPDKVKVEGEINTYVMYLPDSKDDNVRALNCNINFSKIFDIPDIKEGMLLRLQYEIKEIECKVINGRKIKLKVGVELAIKVYSNEDVEIITETNDIENLQTLKEEVTINSLIGNSQTSIYAKETLNINNTHELAEILQVEINLCDKDMKLSYNKVLTKAEANVNIVYLTEDNQIGKIDGRIPIVGFIDIPNISEENQVDINYEIKNISVKPNSVEDHSIYVELEVKPDCMVYENKNISLIQDLYSPTKKLEFKQRKISTLSNIMQTIQEFKTNKIVQIPGVESDNIVTSRAKPVINNVSINNKKITYIGEIQIDLILLNNNVVTSNSTKIPFEVTEDSNQNTEFLNVETEIIIENTEINIKNHEEIEVTVKAKILKKINKNIVLNIIDSIEIINENDKKDDDYDSLVLYITQPNDTLWKIAKKFNSTLDELSKVNGMEDRNIINIGQKIYIPKFNYIRKKNENESKEITV